MSKAKALHPLKEGWLVLYGWFRRLVNRRGRGGACARVCSDPGSTLLTLLIYLLMLGSLALHFSPYPVADGFRRVADFIQLVQMTGILLRGAAARASVSSSRPRQRRQAFVYPCQVSAVPCCRAAGECVRYARWPSSRIRRRGMEVRPCSMGSTAERM